MLDIMEIFKYFHKITDIEMHYKNILILGSYLE